MAVSVDANHKRCAVVSVDSPGLPHELSFGSSCFISNDGSVTGFKSDNGLILSLINKSPNPQSLIPEIGAAEGDHDVENCETIEEDCGLEESTPKRRRCAEREREYKKIEETRFLREQKLSAGEEQRTGRKKVRSLGMVNGSISVVHQLHALVANRCMKIISRVVKADKGENGEERAVVLVDVSLLLHCGRDGNFLNLRLLLLRCLST